MTPTLILVDLAFQLEDASDESDRAKAREALEVIAGIRNSEKLKALLRDGKKGAFQSLFFLHLFIVNLPLLLQTTPTNGKPFLSTPTSPSVSPTSPTLATSTRFFRFVPSPLGLSPSPSSSPPSSSPAARLTSLPLAVLLYRP
jgi:hypothetical protein